VPNRAANHIGTQDGHPAGRCRLDRDR